MKKTILYTTLLLLLVFSCEEEDQQTQSICESSCEDEKVIERIDSQIFKVFSNEQNNLPFTLSPLRKLENNAVRNDDILVPCNLSEEFKQNGLIVIISGNKKNCCNLLTLPNVRTSWGCRFEIISIEKLESLKD